VLKLAASGNALVYSTYLGGSSIDVATALAVDTTGKAYVAGYTASTDFPTATAVQSSNAGGYDAFIAELNPLGNTLAMATYLGGTGSDSAYGIALDAGGNTYLAGQTMSGAFPLAGATQLFELSPMSAFVTKVGPSNQPPQSVSVSPSSGSGSAQTFTFVFSDASGAAYLYEEFIVFGQNLNLTNACVLAYNGATLYLLNNTATTWLGPAVPGSSSSLGNSQCTISMAGSSATSSGPTLTLTLATTFSSAFAGAQTIYMHAIDRNGLDSGVQARGTWTISASPTGVSAVSVSPSSGSGFAQTFTFVFSDTSASYLSEEYIVFGQNLNLTSACVLAYNGATLYLLNNTATVWLGPAVPGSSSSLGNSQCTISMAGSSATSSGPTLTLTLATTFSSAFAGAQTIYMHAVDRNGLDSGVQARGTWTVP